MTKVFSKKELNDNVISQELIGLDNEFSKLEGFCELIWSNEWSNISNILHMMPTILLHGAPGTGKTTLLMKVAKNLVDKYSNKVKYYRECLDLFADKDLGETSKNIKELFDVIIDDSQSEKKVFLQLDDIDSLLSSRYMANESSGIRRAVNTFITQLDELQQNTNKFNPIIATTTNMNSHIDTAITRRFCLMMRINPAMSGDNFKKFLAPKLELLELSASSDEIKKIENVVKKYHLTPYDLLKEIQHSFLEYKIGIKLSIKEFIEKLETIESSKKSFDEQETKFSNIT